MLDIRPARWTDYRRFVNLCCVNTMPFHGGKCWTVDGDRAFIGYNFCYRNNRQRNLLFPNHLLDDRFMDVHWLNQNFRCLNRVMVRPKYRGQGIATELVKQTLPLVGVPFVECLTWAHLIRNILLRCDFSEFTTPRGKKCGYYLWVPKNS